MPTDLRNSITFEHCNGKPVAIFEHHHYALIPWHDWARSAGEPVRLFSIDFHTNSRPAFLAHSFQQTDGPGPLDIHSRKARSFRERRIKQVKIKSPSSIEAAVRDLRYDEHIDTALRSHILDIAFVVSESRQGAIKSH